LTVNLLLSIISAQINSLFPSVIIVYKHLDHSSSESPFGHFWTCQSIHTCFGVANYCHYNILIASNEFLHLWHLNPNNWILLFFSACMKQEKKACLAHLPVTSQDYWPQGVLVRPFRFKGRDTME
jgi:hypothetical protein